MANEVVRPTIAVAVDIGRGAPMLPAVRVEFHPAEPLVAPVLRAGAFRVDLTQLGSLMGLRVLAPPSQVPPLVSLIMASADGHWQSDPHVQTALQAAATAQQAGAPTCSVFVPAPSVVQPQFERRATPRSPAEAGPSTPALDSPLNRSRQGVSMKPSTPSQVLDDRAPKPDPSRPAEAFDSHRMAELRPDSDPQVARDHGLYVEVRELLRDGFAKEIEQRPQQAQRQPEQVVKLDQSAHEYFARPTAQRDFALQRQEFVSLLVAPLTLQEAKQMLQAHYGQRLAFDDGILTKLAAAYAPGSPGASKEGIAQAPPDKTLQDATFSQAKAKGGRLPEEMLVSSQQELRAAPKKHARHRRIDALSKDGQGGQSSHQPDSPLEEEQGEKEDEEG